jgi:hypothetical protein
MVATAGRAKVVPAFVGLENGGPHRAHPAHRRLLHVAGLPLLPIVQLAPSRGLGIKLRRAGHTRDEPQLEWLAYRVIAGRNEGPDLSGHGLKNCQFRGHVHGRHPAASESNGCSGCQHLNTVELSRFKQVKLMTAPDTNQRTVGPPILLTPC